MLQEIVQKNKQETLEYRLAGQSGPDHDKRFTMELLLNSNVFAEGIGKSKKEAEQMAAKKALENMGCGRLSPDCNRDKRQRGREIDLFFLRDAVSR